MTYDHWKTTEPEPFEEYPPDEGDEMEETMASITKPMSGSKLASIITALGNAYDYGTAAILNSNPEERAELEKKMLNRLQAAAENADWHVYMVGKAA